MTHSEKAVQWALDVTEGRDDQCLYVRLACQRFLDDLDRIGRDEWPYFYDAQAADDRCAFIEKLPHVKGQWAARGETIALQPWQCFIVCNLFGWKHNDTLFRRFRQFYGEVPRKNAKSTLAAGIGISMFCDDGEYGAEVYSGATSEKQAFEVFRPARQMVLREPELRDFYGIDVAVKNLSMLENGSRFEPVIGNPGDGASPSCAIADEYHEHSKSDLVDTMVTGMGAREQPLLLVITTAGTDFGGPCREMREDVIRILDGTFNDETIFAVIFGIDEGDRWDTEAALAKANPNLDVSVSREFLLSQLAKARRNASLQNAYKTKHLNMWVGAKVSWINMLELQRCKHRDLVLEQFAGQACTLGLDLASKRDVASLAMLFEYKDGVAAFVKHYLPYAAVYEDAKNPRYKAWAEAGLLNVTEGNVTDFNEIEADIKALAATFDVRECAFDPWQATQMSINLAGEGLTMVEVRPTVQNFSEPMKELDALVAEQKFYYDGDPVLTWMFGNVVAKMDKKDNIFPNKERDDNKIDGVVALIMAYKRIIDQAPRGLSMDDYLQNPVIV